MVDNIASSSKSVWNGIAAEDLKYDSVVLEIISPDFSPGALSGTVGAGIATSKTSLKDVEGNPVTGSVTTSNHVVATWDGESNMRSPPLVRKGEPVELIQYRDQDKFFWRSTGKGRDFRKTDRVIVEVAAVPQDDHGSPRNDTNTYSVYLDSERKKVGIRTSKANGEKVAMVLEADLGSGTFYISDDSESPGNRIFLDMTDSPLFQVNLSTGACISLNNRSGLIQLPDKLLVSTGERIVFDSPLIVLNKSTVGKIIINGASISIRAARDAILTAGGVLGLNSASTKISGILIAGMVRLASLFKGSPGQAYSPMTIGDVAEGRPSEQNNVPDTTSGTPVTSLPV